MRCGSEASARRGMISAPFIPEATTMALMDFIKKQFIDIIQWTETGDGTLAWRFPICLLYTSPSPRD